MSFSFQGSENKLVQNWTWSCDTMCSFDYSWYPFDTQNCLLHRTIFGRNLELKSGTISYTGGIDIGKYYLRNINYCIDEYDKKTLYIDLIFNRPLTGSFMSIFLPTGMLLMISQMSTVFSSSFLDMVIEVNTTLLLVLTTL